MAPHQLNNNNYAEKNQFVPHYLFLPLLIFLFLYLRRSVGIWESCFQCFWETPKCKKTVKKFLDELIYFLVLYMQITEEQVGFVFHFYFQPIISSLFCTHIPNNRWLLDIQSNLNQFAEDEDDDTFSFSVCIATQDVLSVSEWKNFNIQFTPLILVHTPFSYGAHLLCYN